LTASGKILKRDIAAQIVEGKIVPSPIRFIPDEKPVSA
jgi:hypothetical protein